MKSKCRTGNNLSPPAEPPENSAVALAGSKTKTPARSRTRSDASMEPPKHFACARGYPWRVNAYAIPVTSQGNPALEGARFFLILRFRRHSPQRFRSKALRKCQDRQHAGRFSNPRAETPRHVPGCLRIERVYFMTAKCTAVVRELANEVRDR